MSSWSRVSDAKRAYIIKARTGSIWRREVRAREEGGGRRGPTKKKKEGAGPPFLESFRSDQKLKVTPTVGTKMFIS